MTTQLITPNPNVACTPNYCLKYVQDAAKLKAVYPTARAAWDASQHKHFDYNYPSLWVPLWFDVLGINEGHVVWKAPDNSLYSASSPTAHTPVHHASLDALYNYYGQKLKYLGWTEDLEGTLVIKEEDMGATKEQLQVLWGIAYPNEPLNPDWVSNNTGKDWSDVVNWLRDDATRQALVTRLVNDAAAYENQKSVKPTPLAKGVYEVK